MVDIINKKTVEEITVKEVYERLIRVETLVTEKYKFDKKTTRQFIFYVVIIVILELVNIFVHAGGLEKIK